MNPTTKAVVSMAADPNAPSFLNLPAEIRNLIYGLLFVHEDDLQLAEVADGSVALVQRSSEDDTAELEYYESLQRYRHNGIIPSTSLPQPRRVRQDGLHLLHTCHQAHHEAAPMLYANTFLIHATRGECHDPTGRRFNRALSAWLHRIGQHNCFVRKLVIDLGAIGPWDCACGNPDRADTLREDDDYIRCGALLNAIWSSDTGIFVSFIDSGPIPSTCMRPFRRQTRSLESSFNLENLNSVIQRLAQDELGMKKFRRAIGEIGLYPDGLEGVFVFRTTDWEVRQEELNTDGPGNPFFLDAKFFEVIKDDTLRFCDNKNPISNPTTVLGFPLKVFDKILAYTLDSVTSCEIDLDSFCDFTDLHGIFFANSWLHEHRFAKFLLSHSFNITMMVDNNANLDFEKLRRLLNVRIGCHHGLDCNETHEHRQFGLDVDYSINLHIHLGTCATASSSISPRINMMPLVVATFESNPDRQIHVHVHSGNGEVKCNTISIQALRRSIVPVLRDYVRMLHAKDAGVLCPELWMNSEGRIEAVSTSSRPLGRDKDPAKEFKTLWSAWKTGYVDAEAPPVPELGGLARSMYLYLEWITM